MLQRFLRFEPNITTKRVMLCWKFVCGSRNNMTRFWNHKICFQHSQCVVSKPHVGLYVESKLHGYVDSIFCFFFLTGQLESIPLKFRLAGVVLVVSKPHVFNKTGQLALKPPELPTLAATDLPQAKALPPERQHVYVNPVIAAPMTVPPRTPLCPSLLLRCCCTAFHCIAPWRSCC